MVGVGGRSDRPFRLRSAYIRPEPSAARLGILRPVKTILIVDDERNIVDLLRLYLEKKASRRSRPRTGSRHSRSTPGTSRTS